MNVKNVFYILIFLIIAIFVTSCYSLKGISISPNTNTYYVETFQNKTENAPAEIAQQFSESLKDKINQQTRLNFTENEPDIEFSGAIASYVVNQQAPQKGDVNSFNRLTISVKVSYIDNRNEKNSWEQSFSYYEDFDESADVTTVHEALTSNIFEQLVDDVFNKAFTNW